MLVVVDGFGWSAAERHAEHPFLRRVAAEGVLSQLHRSSVDDVGPT